MLGLSATSGVEASAGMPAEGQGRGGDQGWDQQERNVREGGTGVQWRCAGRGSKGCTCIGLKPAVIQFRVSNLPIPEPILLNFHLFQVTQGA